MLKHFPADALFSTSDDHFMADTAGAVELYAGLAQKVTDAEYDGLFEPSLLALVSVEDGKHEIRPVAGFRTVNKD
jgi:hypothetical protein